MHITLYAAHLPPDVYMLDLLPPPRRHFRNETKMVSIECNVPTFVVAARA